MPDAHNPAEQAPAADPSIWMRTDTECCLAQITAYTALSRDIPAAQKIPGTSCQRDIGTTLIMMRIMDSIPSASLRGARKPHAGLRGEPARKATPRSRHIAVPRKPNTINAPWVSASGGRVTGEGRLERKSAARVPARAARPAHISRKNRGHGNATECPVRRGPFIVSKSFIFPAPYFFRGCPLPPGTSLPHRRRHP